MLKELKLGDPSNDASSESPRNPTLVENILSKSLPPSKKLDLDSRASPRKNHSDKHRQKVELI
jgi:hypothetical protein